MKTGDSVRPQVLKLLDELSGLDLTSLELQEVSRLWRATWSEIRPIRAPDGSLVVLREVPTPILEGWLKTQAMRSGLDLPTQLSIGNHGRIAIELRRRAGVKVWREWP